jgi:hypothetical protein
MRRPPLRSKKRQPFDSGSQPATHAPRPRHILYSCPGAQTSPTTPPPPCNSHTTRPPRAFPLPATPLLHAKIILFIAKLTPPPAKTTFPPAKTAPPPAKTTFTTAKSTLHIAENIYATVKTALHVAGIIFIPTENTPSAVNIISRFGRRRRRPCPRTFRRSCRLFLNRRK